MPSLIRPNEVRVTTTQGEVTLHITLDLNVNLNTGGVVGVAVQAQAQPKKNEEEEKAHWAIPDFSEPNIPKVKFGKESSEESK